MSAKNVIITLLVIFSIGAKSNSISRDFFVEYDNFTLAINGSTLSPELTFNDHAVDKMRLAYGLWNGTASNKTCTVFQNTHFYDLPTKSQSCKVDISAINQNDTISGRVALLNNDTLLILAKSGHHLQLINVQLDSCQTYKTTVTIENEILYNEILYTISVVPDENTYDVIYMNPEICGARRCKITFDYKDGRIVKNVTEWGPLILKGRLEGKILHEEFVQTIAPRSSKQGYLIFEDYWNEKKKVYLVREHRSKLLFESETDSDLIPTISIANNKIGICAQTSDVHLSPYSLPRYNYSIECKQYDLDGSKVKLDIQIPMEDAEIDSMAMFNLPDGFILMIKCYTRFYQIYACDGYRIMRFDGNGTRVYVDGFDNFDCKNKQYAGEHLVVQFYENGDDEYCVTHTCRDSIVFWADPTCFSLTVRCFKKSDL